MRSTVRGLSKFGLFCLVAFIVLQGRSLHGQGGGAQQKGDITGVNTAGGSGLVGGVASGEANLSLLTTCTEGQLLKRDAGAWVCAADNSSSGGGTVTGVTAGTGLTATPTNPITTSGTLAIDTTVVPRLGVANTFTANQSITGSLTITGGNISLPATTGSSVGVLNLGANSFLHGFGDGTSTFVGRGAGNFSFSNTGVGNSGLGTDALVDNTSGSNNTALGNLALPANTAGLNNTAVGSFALRSNNTGSNNIALGRSTLFTNTSGSNNTALGGGALANNTTGGNNLAIGPSAMAFNTDGQDNIVIGLEAGSSLATSNQFNIYLGNGGAAENNTIRIGTAVAQTKAFIAGINNAVVSGVPVVVDGNGQLGVASLSSRRFKYEVQDMNDATRKLLQLHPVTFRYKQALNDGSQPLQYGLIAEEVAEVYPELVQKSPEGEATAVLYHVLPAMLLNEFQKQHRQIEAQDELIQSLREQLAQLSAASRELQAEVAALKVNSESSSKILAAALQQ